MKKFILLVLCSFIFVGCQNKTEEENKEPIKEEVKKEEAKAEEKEEVRIEKKVENKTEKENKEPIKEEVKVEEKVENKKVDKTINEQVPNKQTNEENKPVVDKKTMEQNKKRIASIEFYYNLLIERYDEYKQNGFEPVDWLHFSSNFVESAEYIISSAEYENGTYYEKQAAYAMFSIYEIIDKDMKGEADKKELELLKTKTNEYHNAIKKAKEEFSTYRE